MNSKTILLVIFLVINALLVNSQQLFYTVPEHGNNPEIGIDIKSTPYSVSDNYLNGWPWEWQTPVNTGSFSFVLIEDTANPRINNFLLSDGDFIGAFYTGNDGTMKCAGAGEWLNQTVVFPIVGDDQLTPVKEGFSYNEVINFGFFDHSKNKTYFLPIGNFSYGTCANCNITGRYANTMIYRIVDMFYNYKFDVIAKAEPDSICNSGITQLNSYIDGTGGPFNYLWTSNPAGFSSNIANPQFFINQTVDFFVKVTDATDSSSHHALVRVFPKPLVYAGQDQSICSGSTVQLSSSASNYKSIAWSTSGNGVFNNPNITNPVYSPGTSDINNGHVWLILRATSNLPCNDVVIDSLEVVIIKAASVNAGPDGIICAGDIISLGATATNYSSLIWSRNGSGTPGTFNNPTLLNPIYTPSGYDNSLGYVNFTITVYPITPCTIPASDQITVNITKTPVSTAGNGGSICASGYFSTSASAFYYHHTLWSTTGDGYFQNPNLVNTNYFPGPIDQQGRNISLSLTAYPNSPCSTPAISSLNLFIRRAPSVIAPNDGNACSGNPYSLTATAFSYSSVTWTSSGSGTFTAPSSLTTQYIPSNDDAITGTLTIKVSIAGIYPCSYFVADSLQLSIMASPTSNAGNDQYFCDREPVNLNGIASNYNTIQWITTGDGIFSNPTSLTTLYTPGISDTTTGFSRLILKSVGLSPCSIAAFDTLFLIRVPNPEVNIGYDSATICFDQSFTCSGTVSGGSGLHWITEGDGTFSNPLLLNPVYYPGYQDITNGYVNLSLVVQLIEPCDKSVSDHFKLKILQNPTVNAGSDGIICSGDNISLDASATNYSSVTWSRIGTGNAGTFNNPNILNPIYLPSEDDKYIGYVNFSIQVEPLTPCTAPAIDLISYNITKLPSSNSGNGGTICGSDFFETSASASNFHHTLWTSSGDGYFEDQNLINTRYFPGQSDQMGGSILLTLTAFPNFPCSLPATSSVEVLIQAVSTVSILENGNACVGNAYGLSANANSYLSIVWTSTGNGSFSNPNSLNTSYTPASSDAINGSIVIRATVTGIMPCYQLISDSLLLTVLPSPTAYAGDDQNFCGLDPITITGEASNMVSIEWITTGDGSFSNPNSLNTIYSPGISDTTLGSCKITLRSIGSSPCLLVVTDTLVLSKVPWPQVNAGTSSSGICFNENFQCNGMVTNASGFFWATAGDGTFSDVFSLNPEYFPGEQDIAAEFVILSLTANFIEPCSSSITDHLLLTINPNPIVEAGTDQTVCSVSPIDISGNVVLNNNIIETIQWTTTGSGAFIPENELLTQYYPSHNDSINGSVTLSLNITTSPCDGDFSDQLTINFPSQLAVNQNIEGTTVIEGDDLTLNFEVSGTGNIYYYWFGPNGIIPDENLSTLFISSVSESDAGYYFCLAENECSIIQSSSVYVSVILKLAMVLPSGWSGISTNLLLNEPNIDSILQPLNNNLEVLQNLNSIYWPGESIFGIDSWEVSSGYQILLQNSQFFSFLGQRLPTPELTINIGWNIIPVLSRCSVMIDELLGQNTSIEVIKEVAGEGVYWPDGGINTLQTLDPGKSYFVKTNSETIIEFPVCSPEMLFFDYSLKSASSACWWEKPSVAPNSHIIGIESQAIQEFNSEDIIGAFTQDDQCLGWVKIGNREKNIVLVIFGLKNNDPSLNKIIYKVLNPITCDEAIYNPEFNQGYSSGNYFIEQGISMISSLKEVDKTSMHQDGQLDFEIFPNPAKDEIRIRFYQACFGDLQIRILDEHGKILRNTDLPGIVDHDYVLNISTLKSGVYSFQVTCSGSASYKKLIVIK